jgi:hypothetical protein
MGTKIVVKSIPRTTVTKVSEFRNLGKSGVKGRKLNKNKIFDHCKDGRRALYSKSIGGLKTGLYKIHHTDEQGKEITYQEWAENKWNLPKGFLTNRPFRKGDSSKHEDLSYYQKKVWYFNDGTTILDLDNLDDFCCYHMMLESKYFANSEKEWKGHKWPKAEFYISLTNESAELKYKRNRLKTQAFAKLEDNDFTLPWKRKFTVLLGISRSRTTLTEEDVVNALYEFIDQNQTQTGQVKSDVQRFIELYNKLEDADGRERLEKHYLLEELMDYNIVSEKASTYKWISKGREIGFSLEEAVDFLNHPKKQSQVDDMIAELKLKKV